MAKKTKAKNRKKDTKEERFNFNEEIIIGLKRIDIEEDKPQSPKGAKGRRNIEVKKNKKNTSNKNSNKKRKDFKRDNEVTEIPQIGEGKTVKGKGRGKTVQKKEEKQLTPKQELARKKRKAIFRVTKWLMLFAIIIGAAVYALLSPIFNIKKIDVIGNSKISTDEIISLSEIELEQNMFQYRIADIVKKVKNNAYINSVKVKRRLPDVLEISVAERKTSFMIQFANAYAYISSQGYILEISNKKLELPILTGFKTEQENLQVTYRLCTEDLEKLEDVLKIMEAATSNGLAKFINEIDISNDDNYKLTMKTKKKTIYLGDTSNLSTKMLWILTFNEREGNTPGDIMLNMNLNDEKNKPVFRKKI